MEPSRRTMLRKGASLMGLTALRVPEPTGVAFNQEVPGPFADKVVLITGATSGIGKGTACYLAQLGAKVFFNGRRAKLGQQVQQEIRDGSGEATYYESDVRVEEQVKAFVDACIERYGRIDVAFNNAGVANSQQAPLAEQPTGDWENVMNTNARGVFLSMKYELPYLLRNEPDGRFGIRGRIINTASVSGHVGFSQISPYSTSKHAIIGMTRCAAIEYGPQGIQINSISPGGVDTPMRNQTYLSRGMSRDEIPTVPNFQRRINTVQEMADVVAFLASTDASSIFGTDLDLTGGMLTGAYFTQPSS